MSKRFLIELCLLAVALVALAAWGTYQILETGRLVAEVLS